MSDPQIHVTEAPQPNLEGKGKGTMIVKTACPVTACHFFLEYMCSSPFTWSSFLRHNKWPEELTKPLEIRTPLESTYLP